MSEISKIELPDKQIYNLKDETARKELSKIENIIDFNETGETLLLNVGGERIRLIFNFDKTVTWNFADELSNLSYADVDTITRGDSVTVYGKAIGGTAPYTYSYYFKKATDTNWGTKQANTTATSVSITLGSAVVYNLKVVVKDKNGMTAEKIININVTAAEGDEPYIEDPAIESEEY